jgi:predicted transcriptional regulator
MELQQEIELWYVIPALRKELVLGLKKHNVKQKDIAAMLGLTGSAVSQYMKDKRATCKFDESQAETIKPEIDIAVKNILAEKIPNPNVAMKEINRICRMMREKKITCAIHRKKNQGLCDCGVCYE